MLDCPGHAAWRTQAEKDFSNDLIELKTPKFIRTTLSHILFGKRCCPTQRASALYSDCLEIGRLEVWRGRLPLGAADLYRKFKTKNDEDEESMDGAQWSKKVVKIILQMALEMWWCRNKIRHGTDREEEAAIKRKRALQRCTELGERVKRLRAHKNLFVPTDKLKKWTTGMILHYLRWAEPLASKIGKAPNCEPRPTQKWDVTSGEVYDPP